MKKLFFILICISPIYSYSQFEEYEYDHRILTIDSIDREFYYKNFDSIMIDAIFLYYRANKNNDTDRVEFVIVEMRHNINHGGKDSVLTPISHDVILQTKETLILIGNENCIIRRAIYIDYSNKKITFISGKKKFTCRIQILR